MCNGKLRPNVWDFFFMCLHVWRKMKFTSELQLLSLVIHIPKNLEPWLLSLCWTVVVNYSFIPLKFQVRWRFVEGNVQCSKGMILKKREQIFPSWIIRLKLGGSSISQIQANIVLFHFDITCLFFVQRWTVENVT